MLIEEIIKQLSSLASESLQESYDNSGLQYGNPKKSIDKVLITLDINEKVINEAIEGSCGMIISHHPLIFDPIKKIAYNTPVGRCITKAIKNDIAIYVMHTNLDNSAEGLNYHLIRSLGVSSPKILFPGKQKLNKIATFCPESSAEVVSEAMFEAGAGNIGNYDKCSFRIKGTGTYRPLEGSDPYIGERNTLHKETETRLEMIVPIDLTNKVVNAMKLAHPYEEVAYDVIPLGNPDNSVGSGAYGELSKPLNSSEFIKHIKKILGNKTLRHSITEEKRIKRIGVCGGSGGFLIDHALNKGLDAFITSDLKYHQFCESSGKILLIDAGHFETEIIMVKIISDYIQKKIPNFACRISEHNTNPVIYS